MMIPKRTLITSLLLLWVSLSYAQNRGELFAQLETAYENEDYEVILDMESDLQAAFGNATDHMAAEALAMLGETHYFEGDADKAREYSVKAYQIHQDLDSVQGVGYANLVYNLTYMHYEIGMYAEALAYGEQMLTLDKANYGVDSEEYAATLTTLSSIYQGLSQPRKAEKLCRQALQEISPKTFSQFIVTAHLGDLYSQLGEYSQADEQLLSALALAQYLEGSNTLEYAATLVSLATLYRKWGRYAESERFFLDASDIINNLPPSPLAPEYQATVQNNLANMYVDMARYAEAMTLYEDLKVKDADMFGTEHPNYAITLLNASRGLRRQGQLEKANAYLNEAIDVFTEVLGPQHILSLSANSQQVELYTLQGEYDQAEATADALMKAIAKEMGKENPYYLRNLFSKGLVLAKQNDARQARKLISKSQQIGATVYSTRHPEYARYSRQLAVLNWYDNRPEEAIRAYNATFENYFGQIDAYFPALSEPEKAKFYNNTLKVTFEEFNSFAIAQSDERPELLGQMYDYQLATKALIMYSTGKVRESIMASEDAELIQLFNDWLALKERISRLYSMSNEELAEQPEPLNDLVEQANRLEKDLGNRSQAFAGTFSQERTTWQQVRDHLSKGEAAIEIIRFRTFSPEAAGHFEDEVHYAALIVRHDTRDHPQLVVIKNGKMLESDWTAYYRNSILYRLDDEESYSNFWAPLKPSLNGIDKVFISPDGLYHQVSFNTLKNPETGHFLIDEILVEQVTNTKDIIAYAEEAATSGLQTGKAFFFGFPNYNLGLDEETLAAAEIANKVATTVSLDRGLRGSLQRYVSNNQLLAMLPGTKTEVEAITELYAQQSRNFTTFMGDDAVEEQLKQMEMPSTLHIATHGFFLEDTPEASAGGSADDYVGNPLLRSGLILAGANTFIAAGANQSPLTQEDGILTAYEVMNLNLDQTDLVVMSACETGLGTIKNGEGVYGLQRAFRVAGADAIIMSLWTVSDAATTQLMEHFYENWLTTGDKQEAFRQAQQQLRESFPEPYYWGAFVMVGQ